MKQLLFVLLVLSLHVPRAQVTWIPELHMGYGFNPGLHLNNEAVINPGAFVSEGGITTELMLSQHHRICLLTGLFVRFCRNEGEIPGSSFVAYTSRAVVPLLLGYHTDKWKFSAGGSIQNNRDFNDVFSDQLHNFRFNAMARADYFFAPRCQVGIKYIHSVSQVDAPYFVLDPEHIVLVGCSFVLHDPGKK